MKLNILLLAGAMLSSGGAGLEAQGKPRQALQANETAIVKERRKSLQITNDSSRPWRVGVVSMEGSIELLELKGNKFTKKGVLAAGAEITIPMGTEGLLLSPAPPAKWAGMVKTGQDFSARMYLRDDKAKKLNFTMTRVADAKDTLKKTCSYLFDKDFDPQRFGAVLLLPEPDPDFKDAYTRMISIVGDRLPPPGPKTRPDPGP